MFLFTFLLTRVDVSVIHHLKEILEVGYGCGTQQEISFPRPVTSFTVILGLVGQIVCETEKVFRCRSLLLYRL